MKPTFFATGEEFRRWLAAHHDKATELYVGFYKKSSAKKGITYAEAIDEALCYGWIDGVVKSLDADRYQHRFTPRKSTSHWSNVNVKRYRELATAGRVHGAGDAAWRRRTPERTGKAAYEQPVAELSPAHLKQLKSNRAAWTFYQSQAPSYQRLAKHWIARAKQQATRDRRLELLIEYSAKGERVPRFISPPGKK